MAKKTTQELAADISDPSDFALQPELVGLDSSLRCNICRDVYDAPVSISCGHCFCSLCVRESMNVKAECPICRKAANESNIRPNVALNEAAEAWKLARDFVLRILKESDERNYTKRCRSNEDYDEVHIVAGPSKRQKTTLAPADKFVECPACTDFVEADLINQHLDHGCLASNSSPPGMEDRSKQKNEWSKLMGGKKDQVKERVAGDEEDRLPKVSYHIMKEKQLRDMLARYSLSTSGDKNLLTIRHQQWTMMWNANQDRPPEQRHSVDHLRKALKKWEDIRSKRKEVVENPQEHEKTYREEFEKLIERARPKKPHSQASE